MKTIHFCVGLPRSGSTVLMNILQQNPEIFTTGTCALTKTIQNILVDSRHNESFIAMDANIADNAMFSMVQGATQGWFDGLTNKPVIISKNRAWAQFHHLYPNSKFIVMIRDIRDVVESFNKLNSKIKALHSYDESGRMYACMSEDEKYHYHFNTSNAFSVSFYQDLTRLMYLWENKKDKIKFVRYEDFLLDPLSTLNNIYKFLSLSSYQHDLYNIDQSFLYEHDHAYFKERTNHYVNDKIISYNKPERILSDSFHNRIVNEHKWFYEGFYPNVN